MSTRSPCPSGAKRERTCPVGGLRRLRVPEGRLRQADSVSPDETLLHRVKTPEMLHRTKGLRMLTFIDSQGRTINVKAAFANGTQDGTGAAEDVVLELLEEANSLRESLDSGLTMRMPPRKLP